MLSFHTVGKKDPERVYQAFILGMLVNLQSTHEVESERENGLGRSDVMIIPKDKSKLGVVIELNRTSGKKTQKIWVNYSKRDWK